MFKYVAAIDLLTPQRLDIIARIPLADALISGEYSTWGLHVYVEYLKCMTKGVYGEDSKYSQLDYILEFGKLVNSIKTDGFDPETSTVPIRNSQIVNGAHRVATCISLNLNVAVDEISAGSECQNYEVLQKNGLPDYLLDYLVLNFVRRKASARAFVLLDSPAETLRKVVADFPNSESILCVKSFNLSEIGKRRIIDLMYSHNSWWTIGLLERFVAERFTSGINNCSLIVFDSTNVIDIQAFKENLRKNLETSEFERKLHGTDFQEDTVELCKTLLNENGIFFLNMAPYGAEERVARLVAAQDFENSVLVGSAPLEIFGIREARDLDYMTANVARKENLDSLLTVNPGGYRLDAESLNVDPRFFIEYKDLKFASLPSLLFYKSSRVETKDLRDLELVVNFLSNHSSTYAKSETKASAFILEKSRRRYLWRSRISPFIPKFLKKFLRKVRL